MNRPHVQIESENNISMLRHYLEKMLPEFEALPGVMGLTLNDGLSRGYADHLSEIDKGDARHKYEEGENMSPLPCTGRGRGRG